jgi:hypothetical protein
MSLPRTDLTDANVTMRKLKEMLKHHKDRSDSLDNVESSIRHCFREGLNRQPNGLSNLGIYMELEKNIEPAALEKFLGSDIYSYLTEINALNSFKKTLTAFNIKLSPLKEFIRNPSRFLRHILFIKIQSITIESALTLPLFERGNMPQSPQDMELFNREAASLPFGFSHMHRLSKNLDRYFQPLSFIANAINFLVAIPLYAVLVTTIAAKKFSTYIIKDVILDWFILNLMTGDFYAEDSDRHAQLKYNDARKYLLDYQRLRDNTFLSLSDDELLYTLNALALRTESTKRPDAAEIDLENALQTDIRPKGIVYVKLVARAIYDKLFNDNPAENGSEQFQKYVAWPFRLIAALPVIAIAILLETANRLADLAILGGAIIGTAITAVALLTTNTPLIIWDIPGYLFNSAKNLFRRQDNTQALTEEHAEEETDTLIDQPTQSPRHNGSYHLLGTHGLLASDDEQKSTVTPVNTTPFANASIATTVSAVSSSSRIDESLDDIVKSLGLRG